MSLLRTRERYNGEAGRVETEYYLDDADFIRYCVTQLKSAAYIAEDEMGERYYLGSELRAHVFQSHLPGQFFTFNGKYYEMLCLSGDGQVLVRRAADLLPGVLPIGRFAGICWKIPAFQKKWAIAGIFPA